MAEPDRRDTPLAAGERSRPAAGVPLANRPGPGILVVDDDGNVLRLLGTVLRRQGFAVWLAAGGPEALGVYRLHGAAVDVVLLDVCMPGVDGPQTLAALRGLNPAIRCCFMSADLGSYTEGGLRKLGVAAVLAKPLRLAELVQVLQEVAGRVDADLPGP